MATDSFQDRIDDASKVPAATAGFWLIKILATTLGETGGDAVSMSMGLGYLAGTAIFLLIFVFAVAAQIRATRLQPALYWFTIIASTTVGTTLADCHASRRPRSPGDRHACHRLKHD